MFKQKNNNRARIKLDNYVFVIISTDFTKVVCKNFTKLKNNPFYGISVEKFDYKLHENYLTFSNEQRAENALNHYYITELAQKENCEFRVYCLSKLNKAK